ncbi:hypothetical protein [Halobacillus karajensis]|uniref:Uncharacterized protein n=1 Tax=Halobacillus karajensis TaxID=195088 RepID=A0A024P8X6_9BACI|nr:hypothetical protein [Halobacillus karajensis]CDQ20064.1 hypothetical protein BN982_02377 [Halobacillus karajensis]CDQ25273.1 hypothetical protein BN983_03588 [Halobacillus karajensis]CDQ28366.1 hypothetical protein BN981_02664 [Halobacillus karajensis]
MKKYLIFIGSFILLYFVYQMASGILLTMNDTTDFSSSGGFSAQELSFGNRTFDLLVIVLIANLTYFLTIIIRTKR